jgi:lysozyme family protein
MSKELDKLEEGTRPWYRQAWKEIKFRPGYEAKIEKSGKLILAGRSRYEDVAGIVYGTSDVWWVDGIIHFMEASCDFKGVLHNGQKIIGTGKKTTIVPKGRGPFNTWEESAVDALKHSSLGLITDFEIGNVFYSAERFNGTGYIVGKAKADVSPYVWGLSNMNDGTGKYTSDGKYDPKASTLERAGVATNLKWLELNGYVDLSKKAKLAAHLR